MADDWQPVTELIETVMSQPGLLDGAVVEVQRTLPEIGRLPAEDVARHARALLAAAARAIAGRRGPTEAELGFIEELAVTRAAQHVPIEAVLSAVHLAGRHVWGRARELAAERGVPPLLLVDARELYDEWAEQVRTRLVVAHRAAEEAGAGAPGDRRLALLRRVLDGGAPAQLALAEAGLPADDGLWVVDAGPADAPDATRLEEELRAGPADLVGPVDGTLVGVLARAPSSTGAAVGVAGPVAADRLDAAVQLARWVRAGARARGSTGPVHCEEVAVEAALVSRPELGERLADTVLEDLGDRGAFGAELARTVVVYCELDRRVEPTARRLFVHPNTVRHRLRRFGELTGLDLDATFGAVAAWWAARAWLARESPTAG